MVLLLDLELKAGGLGLAAARESDLGRKDKVLISSANHIKQVASNLRSVFRPNDSIH